jgi:serine phosphatase RsbU (regulator of sigma subunit)/anti-sigma regulatory factor (Ser/Thr protein kinase)/tetratricopeptide (TPR) repeat protein
LFRNVVKEQLKVPAKIDYLGELRDFVTKVGHRHGYSERVINAFKLSIDEAATNIIKHAYRDWDGDITIRAIVKKNSMTIVLIDQGKYFDPRQVSDPDLQRYVEIGKKGGLGIFIMRRLLDEIDYRKTEEGNELWMYKSRDVARHRKMSVPAIPMTLKARYWLISMAIFSFFLLAVYAFFYFRQDDLILSEYIDRGRSACSLLAREIASNVERPDFPIEVHEQLVQSGSYDLHATTAADQPITALKNTEYSDILFNAFVVDNTGGILASAKESQLLENFSLPANATEVQKDIYRYNLSTGERVLDITWPVIDSKNRPLCRIHFHINNQQVTKDIAKARLNNMNLALLVWAVGAAGLFLLVYIVMNPFRRLSEWVKMLGQPGGAEEMDIDASTEVGEIAQAFSDITQKLRESQVNLAEQERLQKEMQVAQEIQQTLLPGEFPEIEGYEIASYYAAAKEVGGDYFDFVEVDKDTLGIVVADVSGKGVPGSLVMTMIRTALRTEARGLKDAAEVLSRVNDFVVNDMKKGMFVTLFYVIIDSKRRRLNYASAGHNPMILYRANTNKTYYLNPRGFPIGLSLPDKELFKNSIQSDTIGLAEGDILIMYTDGVTEAMNRKRLMFGEERFLTVIRDYGIRQAKAFTEELHNELLSFTEGNPQNDDITLVAITEKTSAEKIELNRAKKVYALIKEGKSAKEACDLAGLTTYAYNKYKDIFAKSGVESYEIATDLEPIEAKHLSIEEKTKIYDVIRRFPDFGAKRISEELNSERYGFTQIAANKLYDELVRSRLNTKELREAFVNRGGKKRRIKPPGTPLLTLDGQVVIRRPGFEPDMEEETTAGEQISKAPLPRRHAASVAPPAIDLVKEKADLESIRAKAERNADADIEGKAFDQPRDILAIDVDALLSSPIEDLLDKRTTFQSDKARTLGEEIEEDTSVDLTAGDFAFEYAVSDDAVSDEIEEPVIASSMSPEDEESFDIEVSEEVDLSVNSQDNALQSLRQSEELGDDLEAETFFDFDYAQSETSDSLVERTLEEIPVALSESEEAASLDIPPDVRLYDQADEDELEIAAMVEAGGGIDEPAPTAKGEESFEEDFIEDAEIISEELTAFPDSNETIHAEAFDELLEIEDEYGLITPEGELDNEVAEQILHSESKEPINAEDFEVLIPEIGIWDIREISFSSEDNGIYDAAERHKLSFDELLETLSEESLTTDEISDNFDLLLDDVVSDPFSAEDERLVHVGNTASRVGEKQEKEPLFKESGIANMVKLYEAENFPAAINAAKELIDKYPDDCKIHVLLGNALFRAEKYHEAAQEYQKVIKLDPQRADAFENLGVVYANQGDLTRAVFQWEQVLEITPDRQDIRDSIVRAKKFLQQA